MLVPNVTWIIAEDSHTYTKLVTNVLSSCQVRGGEGREGEERERMIMKIKLQLYNYYYELGDNRLQ